MEYIGSMSRESTEVGGIGYSDVSGMYGASGHRLHAVRILVLRRIVEYYGANSKLDVV